MIYTINILLILVISLSNLSITNVLEDPCSNKYEKTELQSDFKYFRKKLETSHPNLYLYTSKKDFDALLDSIYDSIGNNTQIEFFNKICRLNSSIKDGHTYFLLSKEYRNYADREKFFLPLDVYIKGNRLFILHNYSEDQSNMAGAEIISLNGKKAETIIKQLMDQQIRDGYNLNYPRWILNNYFRSYYSYSFGTPEIFMMEIKLNNEIITKHIKALPRKKIAEHRIQSLGSISMKGQGIVLELDKQNKQAKLTVKSFDNNLLKNTYNQQFKSSIKEAFDKIIGSNIQNLTIDLKDNQGGDISNASFLCSYLIDQPFKLVLKGPQSKWTKPQKEMYHNKIFVLINGGSFSATGMTASALRMHKKGVFIGEETGGNKVILSGNAWEYKLPNTKIECYISHRTYLLNEGQNDGHGIIPDHLVEYNIENILLKRDLENIVISNLLIKQI